MGKLCGDNSYLDYTINSGEKYDCECSSFPFVWDYIMVD